jgi:hypothetical protein
MDTPEKVTCPYALVRVPRNNNILYKIFTY